MPREGGRLFCVVIHRQVDQVPIFRKANLLFLKNGSSAISIHQMDTQIILYFDFIFFFGISARWLNPYELVDGLFISNVSGTCTGTVSIA